MRVLSIHAPWCWAILHAGKDVENRWWTVPPMPGPMLLHASKSCTRKVYEEAEQFVRERTGHFLPPQSLLDCGGIVGVVFVREVVTGHPSKWAIPGHHHLVLERATPLPFVPRKGQQKFFPVEASELGKHGTAYAQAWAEVEQIGRAT